MKRKVDLLAAALAEQLGSPCELIQAEAQAVTTDGDQCPQDASTLGRSQGEINVPTVVRKGTGQVNVPNGPGTPKTPQTRSRGQVVQGKYQPIHGEPERKTLVWHPWKAMRRDRTDQTPFYWAPRSVWSE
jgi:hypothetical protein